MTNLDDFTYMSRFFPNMNLSISTWYTFSRPLTKVSTHNIDHIFAYQGDSTLAATSELPVLFCEFWENYQYYERFTDNSMYMIVSLLPKDFVINKLNFCIRAWAYHYDSWLIS